MVDKGSAEYKQSRCIHVLTKGKAKGECCGNKRMEGSDYCKSHTKLKKLTEPMSSAKGAKPKPKEKK